MKQAREKVKELVPYLDRIVMPFVWLSVVLYLIEISTGSKHSHESHPFFLWAERVIAVIFTIEYIIRWMRDDGIRISNYPKSALGIIDLIAILPFWFGFVAPAAWLGMIRTFRILRLLKMWRYSRSLQLISLGFYRAGHNLRSLATAMMVLFIFSTAAIYEAEKKAQPEAFDGLFNSLWFTAVSVTTVGYGDISPDTGPGKVIAMVTFGTAGLIFAGVVGVVGASLSKVLEEEDDPNIDPLKMFAEVKVRNRELKRIGKAHAQKDRRETKQK
jgi:voltage-gated potassium channel